MARGVASVTLPITNLEIAVPLSAMNWFLVHSWINFASFRVFSSFYRSFSFSFSLLFYRSSSLSLSDDINFVNYFILIFNIFKNYQKNYLYLYLATSTKWILLRGSLGNNKGKGWRSIGRIKRENSGIVSDGFGRRERVGTAINIVVQYNAALENSGRVKGPWGVGPEIGVEMFVRPFAGSRVVPLFLSFFFFLSLSPPQQRFFLGGKIRMARLKIRCYDETLFLLTRCENVFLLSLLGRDTRDIDILSTITFLSCISF